MRIKYNPAIDLCCALLQYAHWDEIASTTIPGYAVSSELKEWYQKSRENISGVLNNDINYLIGNFLGLIFLPVKLSLNESITDFSKLLQFFRNMDPGVLPELLYSTYATGIPFSEVCGDSDKIIRVIEKAEGTTRKKEPGLFLDFVRNPAVYQKRLADMMEQFYKIAVGPYEKEVIKRIETQIQQEQKIMDVDPDRFFNGFLKIKYEKKVSETPVYISFYDEIDIIQIEDPMCIIYGRARYMLEENSAIPLEQIYKLLSDDSRRIILKLLCRKPWFIREIADELDLSSATVSYHMSKLAALNLVTYERGERKRVYYCADKDIVYRMLKTVEKDILGK